MTQRTGIFATISIIAAVASYFLTFSHHHVFGLLAGIISIPFGVLGFIMAASPRVSGGIMSIMAIFIGVFAIGIAVLAIIF